MMRAVGVATLVAASCLVSACASGETSTFTVSGGVSAIGVSTDEVLVADGAGAGDSCEATGSLGEVTGGSEVVVLAADGSQVARARLAEGFVPDNGPALAPYGFSACVFSFELGDVPEADGPYTVRVGAVEKTISGRGDDAEHVQLDALGGQVR